MTNETFTLIQPGDEPGTVIVPVAELLALLETMNELRARLSSATAERDRLQRELARTWQ